MEREFRFPNRGRKRLLSPPAKVSICAACGAAEVATKYCIVTGKQHGKSSFSVAEVLRRVDFDDEGSATSDGSAPDAQHSAGVESKLRNAAELAPWAPQTGSLEARQSILQTDGLEARQSIPQTGRLEARQSILQRGGLGARQSVPRTDRLEARQPAPQVATDREVDGRRAEAKTLPQQRGEARQERAQEWRASGPRRSSVQELQSASYYSSQGAAPGGEGGECDGDEDEDEDFDSLFGPNRVSGGFGDLPKQALFTSAAREALKVDPPSAPRPGRRPDDAKRRRREPPAEPPLPIPSPPPPQSAPAAALGPGAGGGLEEAAAGRSLGCGGPQFSLTSGPRLSSPVAPAQGPPPPPPAAAAAALLSPEPRGLELFQLLMNTPQAPSLPSFPVRNTPHHKPNESPYDEAEQVPCTPPDNTDDLLRQLQQTETVGAILPQPKTEGHAMNVISIFSTANMETPEKKHAPPAEDKSPADESPEKEDSRLDAIFKANRQFTPAQVLASLAAHEAGSSLQAGLARGVSKSQARRYLQRRLGDRAASCATAGALLLAKNRPPSLPPLSTHSAELDALLRGGVQPAEVTAVRGPANAGKSLLAHLLCCSAAGGAEAGPRAVYVDPARGSCHASLLLGLLANPAVFDNSSCTEGDLLRGVLRVPVDAGEGMNSLLRAVLTVEHAAATSGECPRLLVVDQLSAVVAASAHGSGDRFQQTSAACVARLLTSIALRGTAVVLIFDDDSGADGVPRCFQAIPSSTLVLAPVAGSPMTTPSAGLPLTATLLASPLHRQATSAISLPVPPPVTFVR